jgi:hypothetical protein
MAVKKIKIQGLKELDEALKGLPAAASRKILENAFLSASESVIVPSIKSAMGGYSQRARDGVHTRVIGGEGEALVGAGVTSDAFWILWADQGTVDRYVTGDRFKGAFRGSINGAQTIQPAIYNSVDKVVDIIAEKISQELQKYLQSKGAVKA